MADQIPLLHSPPPAHIPNVVDHTHTPIPLSTRHTTGTWRSAFFIISVEISERFAYYGISSNLITFLTGPLIGQSISTSAKNVNIWSGCASLFPLIGAFIADEYLGRYRTIVVSSIIYVTGLALLTISALLPSSCSQEFRLIFFFTSLYIVAIGQGGHKPCVQAFGADQFDGQDPEESKAKSSFFNWWYFGLCGGTACSLWILNYIQENLNWGLGFGIPCISMSLSLVVFLLGTKTYRYSFTDDEKGSPFVRVGHVFTVAMRNRGIAPPSEMAMEDATQSYPHAGSNQFKFLDKALLSDSNSLGDSKKDTKVCTVDQVEEAKSILRLIPIWSTCLIYAVVFAQSSTFFTKQGNTMDRSIGSNLKVPAATLQTFISMSIVVFIPIYDRVFVPIARVISGNPSGITMLQRIGFGMFLSMVSMVIAALVEKQRQMVAFNSGLIDLPKAIIPMSVWWLVPQYVLFGIADVFTMVGLQEFFYDQVPDTLRSLGLALYLSIFGIGSLLSSFLISVIESATGGNGKNSWFSNNLNRAHLDYFYWLLAGFSLVEIFAYMYFARSYLYNRKSIL